MPGEKNLGSLSVDLEVDLDEYQKTGKLLVKETKKINGALSTTEKEFGRVEKSSRKASKGIASVGETGKDLIKVLGGVEALRRFGRFLGTSIGQAANFEKGLARVNTVARVSQKELNGLGKEIKKISSTLPVSNQELIDTAFNISSAGVEFQNLVPVLQLSAKVAVGANTTVQNSFDGIIAVVKGYGEDLTEATRIAELFFKTNELGQTTIGEVARNIGQVATTANVAGLSIEELFAVYSTLTGVTGDANRVTTQLKGALNALAAPTAEASKFFKKMGVEVGQAAIEEKGFVQVAKDVYEAAGGNLEILRKLIPEIEAFNLVVALATTQNGKYNESLEELKNSNGSLEEAVRKMVETSATELQIARQKWENFKLSVGNVLIFIGGAFVDLVTAMKTTFQQIVNIAGLALNAVSQFFFNTFGKIIGYIGAFEVDMAREWEKAMNNSWEFVKNFFYNFRVAIENIPRIMAISLGKALQSVADFVNKGLQLLNKLSAGILAFNNIEVQLGKNIQLKEFRGLTSGFEKFEFATLKGVKEFFANINSGFQAQKRNFIHKIKDTHSQVGGGREKIIDQLADNILSQEFGGALGDLGGEVPDLSEAGSKGTNKLKKAVEEALRQAERLYRKNAAISKRLASNREKNFDEWQREIDQTQREIDNLEDDHDRATERITDDLDDVKDKIEEVTKAYQEAREEAEKAFGQEIAEKVVDYQGELKEVRQEIEDLKSEYSSEDEEKNRRNRERINELLKREKEVKKEIAAGSEIATDEELDEAKRRAGLTEIERLQEDFQRKQELRKEEYEADIADLEQMKVLLQEELDAENEKYEEQKKALQEHLQDTLSKQETAASQLEQAQAVHTSKLIALWNNVKRARDRALASGAASQGFAFGGKVTGPGTGTSDSIPARLSDGEFVVNAQSTRRFLPLLEQINARGFRDGGQVSTTNNDNRTLNIPIQQGITDPVTFARQAAWHLHFS